MFSRDDRRFMTRALMLAEKGLYTTTPNPRVGAVIVKEGMVIGEGWHRKAGEAHAEIHAIENAGEAAKGSTLYVTLEPCSHHGRTPPCADAVIGAGISRAVVAMKDPNPLVAGQGIERLEKAGIAVECGLLEDEAFELNPGFVTRMTKGRPWVRLKVAASLDGKTALSSGESRWITGKAARRDGHRFRARSCAILTGIGTVLQDDPMLDVREVETSRQPLRIVLDSRLRLTGKERLFQGKTIVATASSDRQKWARFETIGAEVLFLPDGDERVDLGKLMAELGKRGINELHVEAGGRLNGSLVRSGFVDEFVLYYSPCLIGSRAKGMFDFPTLEKMEDRFEIKILDIRMVGKDLKIIGRPNV
ncbi:MAG TPA: bifunctional diaminohydroxyphosphoribosylaminopyrimidine deaminase/5-amino-6-(5-phosphoribosylamino)uracil reductase RibD [Burkholderiales bacterium]|nr:bifunctional diaminohydroxyphosphoribosylaminopyrimidine deaminase/5-amino-6-(5-phosphoribosylamino)uracil reductase RibD [Burkholderiales bacterium]